MRLGTLTPSFRLGSNTPSRIYLGSNLVWESVDADAAAYFARIVAAGSTISTDNQAAVNTFIVGCKADGIWSAIKASCILAGADTLAGALVPLVGPLPTNVNFVSGDYSRTTGLKGDGSTKYLNSNRNNNADPQNSRHICAYLTEMDTTTSATSQYIGTGFNNAGSQVYKAIAGGTTHGFRSASSESGFMVSRAAGGWGAARSLSTTINRLAAGSLSTASNNSGTPVNQTIAVFATNINVSHTNARISFYSIGEFLNLAQLNARLATLMSSLT